MMCEKQVYIIVTPSKHQLKFNFTWKLGCVYVSVYVYMYILNYGWHCALYVICQIVVQTIQKPQFYLCFT